MARKAQSKDAAPSLTPWEYVQSLTPPSRIPPGESYWQGQERLRGNDFLANDLDRGRFNTKCRSVFADKKWTHAKLKVDAETAIALIAKCEPANSAERSIIINFLLDKIMPVKFLAENKGREFDPPIPCGFDSDGVPVFRMAEFIEWVEKIPYLAERHYRVGTALQLALKRAEKKKAWYTAAGIDSTKAKVLDIVDEHGPIKRAEIQSKIDLEGLGIGNETLKKILQHAAVKQFLKPGSPRGYYEVG